MSELVGLSLLRFCLCRAVQQSSSRGAFADIMQSNGWSNLDLSLRALTCSLLSWVDIFFPAGNNDLITIICFLELNATKDGKSFNICYMCGPTHFIFHDLYSIWLLFTQAKDLFIYILTHCTMCISHCCDINYTHWDFTIFFFTIFDFFPWIMTQLSVHHGM